MERDFRTEGSVEIDANFQYVSEIERDVQFEKIRTNLKVIFDIWYKISFSQGDVRDEELQNFRTPFEPLHGVFLNES